MSALERRSNSDLTVAARAGLAEYAKLAEMDRLVDTVFGTFRGSILAVSGGKYTAVQTEGCWRIVAIGFVTDTWGDRAGELIGPYGRWPTMSAFWASVGVPFAYIKRGAFGHMEVSGAWGYHANSPKGFTGEHELVAELANMLETTMLGASFEAARKHWEEESTRPAPTEEGGFCSKPVEAEMSFDATYDSGPVVRFERLVTHNGRDDFKRRYVRCCR